MTFDPLTTTATTLQQLLQEGAITSVQIVERYLLQIERHNHVLNAFISVAPRDRLLDQAAALDEERLLCNVARAGHVDHSRGVGFSGAKATKNSGLAQKLMDAGLIILGKTNMTEFCGMKMMTSPGRSAVAGQTLSPYVGAIKDGGDHSWSLGGSSTGSAVAVAAGFSPLAVGTETIGSIMTPSSRAALYAIKPTTGRQDTSRMYRMTEFFDRYGPMAKSPADLISILEIILDRSLQTGALMSRGKWESLAVSFVDPKIWKLAPEICKQEEGTLEQMVDDYEAMVSVLQEDGCTIKYPIELQDCSVLAVDGQDAIMPIAYWEFKHIGLPNFIDAFDECLVTSLEDLIQLNKDHAETAMPPPHTEQNDLIKALEMNEPAREIKILGDKLRAKTRRILDEIYEEQNINLIAAPVDSAFCIYAAAAGYPLGHVPLGQLRYNGRPFGLCLMARADGEEVLLRFMSSYEATVSPRPVPSLLQ
ncbi:Amidase signature domain protein [Apiospora kogelbergensis]|uniref:Amidase signature domain protein n=1 Tax=Apiospora kogelbergensis TaxID=1337665 RepID=UPI00312E006E